MFGLGRKRAQLPFQPRGQPGAVFVSPVQYSKIIGALVFKQAGFGADVIFHAPVVIQMVRRDIQ